MKYHLRAQSMNFILVATHGMIYWHQIQNVKQVLLGYELFQQVPKYVFYTEAVHTHA